MAIDINKSTDRVDPPTITLTGQRVRGTELIGGAGTYGGNDDTDIITTLEETVSGNIVTKREVLTYIGDVTVTLTADTNFTAKNYSNRIPSEFVGSTPSALDEKSLYSETYYTLNGKDPIRTKANLYIGAFTLLRNMSGTDNTIIKAKTYVRGKDSEVMKSEIRIIRLVDNKV